MGSIATGFECRGSTDANGALQWADVWPPAVQGGTTWYAQAWIHHPSVILPAQASNALAIHVR